MANSDLPRRFTEENYACKSDVAREMKMSIIEPIWSGIKSYRGNYNRYLTLKSVDRKQFIFCICEVIDDKITQLNEQFKKILSNSSKLNTTNGDLSYFKMKCMTDCLSNLANAFKYDSSSSYIKEIINGSIKDIKGNSKTILYYFNALKEIEKKCGSEINEDFLMHLYSILTNNYEPTSFYRLNNDTSHENRVLIDRVYTSAPSNIIQTMMDELFNFIKVSSLDPISKGLIAYYYITYIKPFSTDNEEIALLLAKSIIAHYYPSPLIIYIPLESILTYDSMTMSKRCAEVQKENDLTYFMTIAFDSLQKSFDFVLDILASFSVKELKEDFYKEDGPSLSEVAPIVEEPIPTPEIKKENPVEAVVPPAVEEKPKPTYTPKNVTGSEQIAYGYIPSALNEEEASRLEEHLLELDPTLKRKEAFFYARHCTLGKMYTIQQFKKAVGCVYETARTSMENLSKKGYYREEMVKNKKVYTPLPRK